MSNNDNKDVKEKEVDEGQRKDEETKEESNSKEVEVDNEQLMGILAYLGILVIIPLVAAKDSDFVMYHVNQGLILLIAWVILGAFNIIPLLGQLIWFFGSIVLFVFVILGIINVTKEKRKPLPVIGKFKLLK